MPTKAKKPIPIVIFCYRRFVLLEALLEALAAQKEPVTHIIAYVDGAKNVSAANDVGLTVKALEAAQKKLPNCQVDMLIRDENLGCRLNIIKGLDAVFETHEKAIILEEDMYPNPHFYGSMCRLLDRFEDDHKIASVSCYNIVCQNDFYKSIPRISEMISKTPTGLSQSPLFSCWGWGTWRERWQEISPKLHKTPSLSVLLALPKRGDSYSCFSLYLTYLLGATDSWASPFQAHCRLENKRHVVSNTSLLRNDGFNTQFSLHTKSTSKTINDHYDANCELSASNPVLNIEDIALEDGFNEFLKQLKMKLGYKIKNLLFKREFHLGRYLIRF